MNTSDMENRREEMQEQLDAQKTQKDRNKLGQFSTPYPLALEIMRYMRQLIGTDNVSFIEPAIGTGVFYSAFNQVFSMRNQHVLGFEIDPLYYNPTKELWSNTPLELRCEDFLSQKPNEVFDMLVANPPYVRHHHLDSATKVRLKNEVFHQTGIKISGLAGLYCYFMMLSTIWLKEGGLSCWLIPSEFMDVNYGEAVKRYLTQNVELLHIHRFKADDLQFADALVSSCIVVFRNCKPTESNQIRFSIGGGINAPANVRYIDVKQLKTKTKWTGLFDNDKIPLHDTETTLGDFFMVKRGIATGDNEFFILDQKTIDRYEIPQKFLRPILPGPRYIKDNKISNKNGLPSLDRQQFLFSCKVPENILREQYPKVWEYIHIGYERGVSKGYICSHRTPWYSCEEREPASIIMPYMGRDANNRMFRFILNTSRAITTNVYLSLYPKPQYAHCMKDETVVNEVWRKLNTIPPEMFSRNGRFYGGGLRKMEPKELMRTPAKEIEDVLKASNKGRQLELF